MLVSSFVLLLSINVLQARSGNQSDITPSSFELALRSHLTPRVHTIDRAVGGLTVAWAKKTGLKAGIPVAVGAFDCHLGAVGTGSWAITEQSP